MSVNRHTEATVWKAVEWTCCLQRISTDCSQLIVPNNEMKCVRFTFWTSRRLPPGAVGLGCLPVSFPQALAGRFLVATTPNCTIQFGSDNKLRCLVKLIQVHRSQLFSIFCVPRPILGGAWGRGVGGGGAWLWLDSLLPAGNIYIYIYICEGF